MMACCVQGLAGKANGLGDPRVSAQREGQDEMAENKPTWQIKADWEPFSTSYPAWLSSDTNAQAVACSAAVQGKHDLIHGLKTFTTLSFWRRSVSCAWS